MARSTPDTATIEAEINLIRSLGIDALRKRWAGVFGRTPPPGLTKDIIGRMIAYRIQEEAFGGLDRQTVKLLDRLAHGQKGSDLDRRLKPGTLLVREYQGERHTVTVIPDGFLWRGETYGSLSTIARVITGTAWNGPRFFGLRMPGGADPANGAQATEARPITDCRTSRRATGPARSRRGSKHG